MSVSRFCSAEIGRHLRPPVVFLELLIPLHHKCIWGAYNALLPLALFKGAASWLMERERKREGRWEGKGGENNQNKFLVTALYIQKEAESLNRREIWGSDIKTSADLYKITKCKTQTLVVKITRYINEYSLFRI